MERQRVHVVVVHHILAQACIIGAQHALGGAGIDVALAVVAGVKQQGGILEFIRREIEVECLPADIPENVEIDVSELMLHQGVRVRDIATNPKWKPMTEPDLMLVHVILPKAEEAPAATTEAAAVVATPAATAEPEVIKKGKKDEEGADKK